MMDILGLFLSIVVMGTIVFEGFRRLFEFFRDGV